MKIMYIVLATILITLPQWAMAKYSPNTGKAPLSLQIPAINLQRTDSQQLFIDAYEAYSEARITEKKNKANFMPKPYRPSVRLSVLNQII